METFEHQVSSADHPPLEQGRSGSRVEPALALEAALRETRARRADPAHGARRRRPRGALSTGPRTACAGRETRRPERRRIPTRTTTSNPVSSRFRRAPIPKSSSGRLAECGALRIKGFVETSRRVFASCRESATRIELGSEVDVRPPANLHGTSRCHSPQRGVAGFFAVSSYAMLNSEPAVARSGRPNTGHPRWMRSRYSQQRPY